MRKTDPHAFGARVRERREALGMSQGELGDAAGYSQQRIGSLEQGDVKRPDRSASTLADALSTTRAWLLWGEGPPPEAPDYLSVEELVENYKALPAERKAEVSRLIKPAAATPRRKTG